MYVKSQVFFCVLCIQLWYTLQTFCILYDADFFKDPYFITTRTAHMYVGAGIYNVRTGTLNVT